MLTPRKPKYRKTQKKLRHIRGKESRGCKLTFGDYGLRVVESGWITNRQIEAGRVALTRTTRRSGKYWIRMFPDKPLTSKPAETRMGKGKGSPDKWVAEVRSGRIIYEITGVAESDAKRALRLAAAKMPLKCEIVVRTNTVLSA